MEFDIVWSEAHESVLVELDERRRTSLGKVGRKEHTRYLVEEQPDGTLIWRPAVVIPEHELRFMTAHPEEYARIREQQASPDPKRLRDRPARLQGSRPGRAESSPTVPGAEPVTVGA